MGCKLPCCNGGEQNTEMIDGNLPETEFEGNKKEFDETKLKANKNPLQNGFNYNHFKRDTVESEISLVQHRNEEIFDFFNDLRNNPQNYIEEAEKYNLADIISSAKERRCSDNLNTNLIKNPFFNLFLDSEVKKTPYSREDILNNIENNEQLKNYKKYLYIEESSIENPNESVWNLLKNNKDKALDEILFKRIDYFIVSCFFVPEKKNVMTYFLFLKKDFNK